MEDDTTRSMRSKAPLIGFVLLFVGLIGANLLHTQASTQVRTTIARVEADEVVRAALGAPIDVIEMSSRSQMRRYTLQDGRDVLSWRTEVRGSRASGELSVQVTNVDDQGWAGTYEVRTTSRPVLVNGSYQTAPARTLVTGTYDTDGSARPPTAP